MVEMGEGGGVGAVTDNSSKLPYHLFWHAYWCSNGLLSDIRNLEMNLIWCPSYNLGIEAFKKQPFEDLVLKPQKSTLCQFSREDFENEGLKGYLTEQILGVIIGSKMIRPRRIFS